MRYSVDHKKQTRTAIVKAAGRVFRSEGYGGSGIDALTKAAGVTNGAFYGHFKTKADAFRTIVSLGLEDLRDAIARFQAEHGAEWLPAFVTFYLGPRLTCDIGDACALPMLSAEVARSDLAARHGYEGELRGVLKTMAAGLGGDEDRALAILALLCGAAIIARAVVDPALGALIVGSARDAIEKIAGSACAGGATGDQTALL